MRSRRRLRRRRDLCLYACASSQNSPAGNTVLYHLRRSSSRNGSNESLTRPAKGSDELLPEQVEVCADLHLRPYYGDEDDTDASITR